VNQQVGRKEFVYYLVGLYGTNGGLPDKQFVQTLHRLYGVTYTREAVFPSIVRVLQDLVFSFGPTASTRLVPIISSLHRPEAVYGASDTLCSDGWRVLRAPIGGLPDYHATASPSRFVELFTWSREFSDFNPRNSSAQHSSYWCTGSTRNSVDFARDARHLHDQLLAGVKFLEIARPAS
jgi:hypothetical protein